MPVIVRSGGVCLQQISELQHPSCNHFHKLSAYGVCGTNILVRDVRSFLKWRWETHLAVHIFLAQPRHCPWRLCHLRNSTGYHPSRWGAEVSKGLKPSSLQMGLAKFKNAGPFLKALHGKSCSPKGSRSCRHSVKVIFRFDLVCMLLVLAYVSV